MSLKPREEQEQGKEENEGGKMVSCLPGIRMCVMEPLNLTPPGTAFLRELTILLDCVCARLRARMHSRT